MSKMGVCGCLFSLILANLPVKDGRDSDGKPIPSRLELLSKEAGCIKGGHVDIDLVKSKGGGMFYF